MMGRTASERSSGHCARLWTSVGHWRDGKNLERHTSDVGAHMAPLGVETAGRAFVIASTTLHLRCTVSAIAYGDHGLTSDGAREVRASEASSWAALLTPVSTESGRG